MQGEFFHDLIVSGVPMLALLPIPVAAVLCSIAFGVGLARRRFVLAVGAVAVAILVGFVAESLRAQSALPSAVDALVMQLPVALAIGALPALVGLVPAATRGMRRRVRALEADAGFVAAASVTAD